MTRILSACLIANLARLSICGALVWLYPKNSGFTITTRQTMHYIAGGEFLSAAILCFFDLSIGILPGRVFPAFALIGAGKILQVRASCNALISICFGSEVSLFEKKPDIGNWYGYAFHRLVTHFSQNGYLTGV